MIQLILCGGLRLPVHGRPVLEQVAWLVPGRWAFAMAAASVDLGSVTRGTADRRRSHSPAVWLADAAILAAIAVAVTVVVAFRLARLDPRHH